jgi:hypothetical protein
MPGDQELEPGNDMDATSTESDDEPVSDRRPSLEEIRAGFMLLDL